MDQRNLEAQVTALQQRREVVAKEAEASDALATETQRRFIAGEVSAADLTARKQAAQTLAEALATLDQQIEAVEQQLAQARAVEAEAERQRRIAALRKEREAAWQKAMLRQSEMQEATRKAAAEVVSSLDRWGMLSRELQSLGERCSTEVDGAALDLAVVAYVASQEQGLKPVTFFNH